MRERDLALLIAHCEIIAAAVFEIADAGDPYAVAVDERSGHHCNFRPPGPVVGRFDTAEPTTTPRKSAAKIEMARHVREYQSAQMPNVRKTSATTRRSHSQGRL